MNTHAATVKRNQRLRRRFLSALYTTRSSDHDGWVSGRFLRDVVLGYVSRGDRDVDDDQVRGLLRDLALKGYAEERDDRERKGDPSTIDYLSYRITANGVSLIEETAGPDPDIEDDRIRK